MATNLALVTFLIAFGFVTSALVYNANTAIKGRTSGFTVSFQSVSQFLFGFVFCMFVGPYLVLERGFTFWRFGGITFPIFLFCFGVALLWSFCSGIFVTQLLMITGIVPIQ
ncbi:MAG: hypothetical protein AAGA53_15780 [Pseudomonadota bacterium]